jgi:hypothetical protein
MSDQFTTYEYTELPIDPEEAFLVLEDRFRRECEMAVRESGEHDNVSVYYTDYIAQVLGAAEELGLVEAAFEQDVPAIQDVDFHTYQNFSKRVKHYRTRLEIRHGRRVQGHSVSFDAPTKAKLQHLLKPVGEIFSKIDVNERKRESLFSKLRALQAEIDRGRTRFDAFAALTIETADIVGEAVERSKLLEVLNSVARIFGTAKEEEKTKQLPAPTKPKQIEHQNRNRTLKSNGPLGDKRRDMDDEIPF